jgi:hypothetical protein
MKSVRINARRAGREEIRMVAMASARGIGEFFHLLCLLRKELIFHSDKELREDLQNCKHDGGW